MAPPHPHPARPDLVRRFTRAERALHWLLAVDVALLTVSGLGLWLGPGSNPLLGHRELVRAVHIDAAIGLLVLPVVIAGAQPGTLARLWREVEWFDGDDWRWLRRVLVPGPLRRGRPVPAPGRLNAGQKLNTIVVAAALVGFTATGAVMDVGAHVPPSVSDAADTWHVWLMFAGAPLVAGHIALATLLPATRGSLRGILTGYVRRDYARRRHGRWAAAEAGPAAGTGADRGESPPGAHP
ncbi:MAG TPA: cytochrome b/b6 domain-containing protein [Candidatus Dormibacteraeota bacterium]|nr:cytochrome b/b6 domain-containing protein [Candidatus Dormibacteraeota bacterium]